MPKTSESRVLAVAIIGTFMVILDQTIMNVALPHIMAVFNETADRAQLVVSAYLMATAISTPAAAFLAQRFGIKKVYIYSQIGFLAGSALVRHSLGQQFAYRLPRDTGPGRGAAQPAGHDLSLIRQCRPRTAARPWAYSAYP